MGTIFNAKNRPLNEGAGSVPDISGAIMDRFQPMQFNIVSRAVEAFQAVEEMEVVNFRGVIGQMSGRALELKPEGQRSWSWAVVYSDLALQLNVDDVVKYLDQQYRVMWTDPVTKLNGYRVYHIAQDWTGAGPTPAGS